MSTNDLIFSGKPKHRLARHVALWVVFCLYFFIVNFHPPRKEIDFTKSETYLEAFGKMIYVPISMLSVYIMIYFLLPRFLLKAKYLIFFILLLSLCAVNLANSYLLTILLAHLTQELPFHKLPIRFRVYQPVAYGLGLSISSSAFAGIIKLLKVRYLRQRENERLQQQKITTELQIIKTQLHPGFLSHALQDISVLIRCQSSKAPAAILKLADLLSYILYENEGEIVALRKELRMIKDYLKLIKDFYGSRLDIKLRKQGDDREMQIAPLILLSLVQNCCEQFLTTLPQKLVTDIKINTKNRHLIFQLNCKGYYENENSMLQQCVDLNQAIRRIQMTYKDRQHLEIHSDKCSYVLLLILNPAKTSVHLVKESTDSTLHESA